MSEKSTGRSSFLIPRSTFLRVVFLTWLLALPGCGGNDKYTLTGIVKFKGTALASGTIAYLGDNNQAGSSSIIKGKYNLIVPQGKLKFTVQIFPPAPKVVPPGSPRDSVKLNENHFVPLPEKYRSFENSGLSFEVKPGEPVQSYNIDLQSDTPTEEP